MTPDESLLKQVRNRGFAVVPGVLSTESIGVMRGLLERCIKEDIERWGKNSNYLDRWMVHNVMARHIEFARVLENEKMHAYLSDLLGATCIVYAYTTSSMPPKGTNYSGRIHVDCPRFIPDYISNVGVMLALDQFTEDNGATYFYPEGHLRPDRPSEAEFFKRAERVFPSSGDMVIFNARTWHLGGKNITDNARHALTINACRAYMKQRFDFPRLTPTHIAEQLNHTGRRFLGFDSRVPTSLEEYYVPEERRLYKANQG